MQWAVSKKVQQSGGGGGEGAGRVRGEARTKNYGLFRFVTLEIPGKMKLRPSALEKLCYIPWNFQDEKPIPTFFSTPGNVSSFFN